MTANWDEVLALGLFIVYALVAFGLRTWLQVRRTGDSGFRGFSGRPGSTEWWAGLLFVLALVTAPAGPVAGLAGLPAVPFLDVAPLAILGAGIAIVGIALTLASQLSMGGSWRIGVDEAERTDLVTGGLFGIVRNPIFTAMAVTGAGLALMVPNLIAFGGWVLLLVAIQLQVRVVEEPYLVSRHGRAYTAYAGDVGRFVPLVGRLADTNTR